MHLGLASPNTAENTIRQEHSEAMSMRIPATSIRRAPPQSRDQNPLRNAVDRAVRYLLSVQADAGYWVGELEGDTILESEYILLMRFLGRGDEARLRKAAAYILSKQQPSGGWAIFPDGPVDVSASVKAYFALKLTGTDPHEPFMAKAREAIRSAGGVGAVNSYTKFYLALLGQIPWDAAPAVPPELMLLPSWFYFNIYNISSWSRTFVVPLSIIWTFKPLAPVEAELGIGDLLPESEGQSAGMQVNRPLLTWRNFFIAVDSCVKLAERLRLLPLRKRAVRDAEEWMLAHFEHSSGLGAIFPPIAYSLIAMRVLGYEDNHIQVERAMEEIRKLQIEEADTLRLQPCTSPVWDTAIAVNALLEAGIDPEHPAIDGAVRWLLTKEVKVRGDWQVKRPNLEPGGWYFEFDNDFYPDIDDTAMVLMALQKAGACRGKDGACKRALLWLLGMQGRDGGWASFDVDNNKHVLNYVPFADHNAMLDPSTSDVTARILEMLSYFAFTNRSRTVRRAIEFLKREQEPDGSWYGRWGVNYVYGTWQAIRGLTTIGVEASDPMVRRGVEWLLSTQNEDGGWGENCLSYTDPGCKGQGASTASQTAWAVMGLMSAGETRGEAVRAGIDYLIGTQKEDGAWDEEAFTGGGFPRVFYLRYHLYRQSFPLMALGMYRRLTEI